MCVGFAEGARLGGLLLFQLLSVCTWVLITLLVQEAEVGFPSVSLNALLDSICTGSVPRACAS